MAQFTTAQVATKLDTNPRTLRKFLRADAKAAEGTTPGKGARYAIEGKDLAGLKRRFAAWSKAADEAKAAKVEAPADPMPTPEEVRESEDISVDS